MDPLDPVDAQQVVIAYARMLERDVSEGRHPARVDSLPYAKPVIKSAIRTSAIALSSSGQLTAELRDTLRPPIPFSRNTSTASWSISSPTTVDRLNSWLPSLRWCLTRHGRQPGERW